MGDPRKGFEPVKDRVRLGAVCRALNVLFWKIPKIYPDKDTDENATFWVSELYDKGINVEWSKKNQRFIPSSRTM